MRHAGPGWHAIVLRLPFGVREITNLAALETILPRPPIVFESHFQCYFQIRDPSFVNAIFKIRDERANMSCNMSGPSHTTSRMDPRFLVRPRDRNGERPRGPLGAGREGREGREGLDDSRRTEETSLAPRETA